MPPEFGASAGHGEVAADAQPYARTHTRCSVLDSRARKDAPYRAISAAQTACRASVTTVPARHTPVAGTARETQYREFRRGPPLRQFRAVWSAPTIPRLFALPFCVEPPMRFRWLRSLKLRDK